MKTTLFIPVKNEIEGSQLVIPRINKDWVDEIIVVDGNSTDGTPEYYKWMGYRVINQRSKGLQGAYWECFEEAKGDVIILFAPDNNMIPEGIPLLVSKMKEGYDLVSFSRYLGTAKSEDDDVVTEFGNWMFTKMANVLHGCHYSDLLYGYRAFRREIIYDLRLSYTDNSVIEVEMAIRAAKKNLRILEIPGDEPKRCGGVRKMRPIRNGLSVLFSILREMKSARQSPLQKLIDEEIELLRKYNDKINPESKDLLWKDNRG